ncbi:MAG: FtsQ-type POTRA domain-containing protein [Lentisphaeria bacterium]|nr:FtsQ-type POTRA domain-containing protein [Lentisphaeria bacterium]
MPANSTIKSNSTQPSRPNGKLPKIAILLMVVVPCILVIVLLCLFSKFCYKKLYSRNPSFRLTNLNLQVEDPSLRDNVEKDLANCGITGISTHKQPQLSQGRRSAYETASDENGSKLLMEPGSEDSFIHLPEIDLKKLRETLLLNPRIEDARLQRIYPDTLNVKVEQRLPVAILHFPPSSQKRELLIDANGIVLPRDLAAATTRLPYITGLKNPEGFVEGTQCESKGVKAFLTFLKEANIREEGGLYQILNVRLEEAEDRMFLTMEKNKLFKSGAQVILPLDDVPAEMDRLKVVTGMRISSGETISKINATYQNIPVTP